MTHYSLVGSHLALVRDNHVLIISERGEKAWNLPGGKPSSEEETFQEIVTREVKEEMDFDCSELLPTAKVLIIKHHYIYGDLEMDVKSVMYVVDVASDFTLPFPFQSWVDLSDFYNHKEWAPYTFRHVLPIRDFVNSGAYSDVFLSCSVYEPIALLPSYYEGVPKRRTHSILPAPWFYKIDGTYDMFYNVRCPSTEVSKKLVNLLLEDVSREWPGMLVLATSGAGKTHSGRTDVDHYVPWPNDKAWHTHDRERLDWLHLLIVLFLLKTREDIFVFNTSLKPLTEVLRSVRVHVALTSLIVVGLVSYDRLKANLLQRAKDEPEWWNDLENSFAHQIAMQKFAKHYKLDTVPINALSTTPNCASLRRYILYDRWTTDFELKETYPLRH